MYNVSEATFSLNIVVKFYFLFLWRMTSSKSFIIMKIQKGYAVYNKKNGKASYIARSFPSSVKTDEQTRTRACRLESVLINLSDSNLMGPWLMRCVRLRLWFSGCSSAVRAERCIYFSPTIHRIMRQYVPWSNMAHSGCFLFIFLISWGTTFFYIFYSFMCYSWLFSFLFLQSVLLVGITAGTVEPLPHVKKYQTVTPQRLEDLSPINAAATARQVRHKRLLVKTLKLFEKWTEVESSPCVSEQTFPDVLQYFLTITEQNYTLHLEKNKWEFTTHLASHCKKIPVL